MGPLNKYSTMAIAFLAMQSLPAKAAEVVFVPPSDSVGTVFTTNSNDAYSGGRGVVFSPTANYNLVRVGLLQDLTNITLSYVLSLTTASTGNLGVGTIISSGSRVVTTSGLEFVDFFLASPTSLVAGQNYHLSFSFTGNSNQNFFYNQSGSQPYSQSGFNLIDGTASNNTSNFVLAKIRLSDSAVGAVPEPATWMFMILGMTAVGFVMRRNNKQTLRVRYA